MIDHRNAIIYNLSVNGRGVRGTRARSSSFTIPQGHLERRNNLWLKSISFVDPGPFDLIADSHGRMRKARLMS